jgi:hypothetical protein
VQEVQLPVAARGANAQQQEKNKKMKTKLTIMFIAATITSSAAAIATLPGLDSIDFYEGTSGLFTYNFLKNSSALNNRLTGTLSPSNQDFHGLANENYDVFYSDGNGNLDLSGAYISIEASYTGSSSSGLNISAVRLNYTSSTELANSVASFVSSTGYVVGSELNAVDGNFNTFTAMGRTIDPERMRVTVGFASTVPEPSTKVTYVRQPLGNYLAPYVVSSAGLFHALSSASKPAGKPAAAKNGRPTLVSVRPRINTTCDRNRRLRSSRESFVDKPEEDLCQSRLLQSLCSP